MNIFSLFRSEIERTIHDLALKGEIPLELPVDRITVEPPRDPSHGDISSNVAMVLAKAAGRSPRDLASAVAAGLTENRHVAGVEVAGPGFVNIRVAAGLWHDCVRKILELGPQYGNSNLGAGQVVNVEYVSANPTGPMHVGHARGAVIGDVLASLLVKAGHEVTREYYVNDAGAQIQSLGESLFLRYREALGKGIGEIPAYPGEYLVPVARLLAEEDGDKWLSVPEDQCQPRMREVAVKAMMAEIREDLEVLGVCHDIFRSEQDLHGGIAGVLDKLERDALVYRGVLDPPKGKIPEDWEEREQLLFRSTRFGDDIDRPLQKSDGSWTYFAADVVYHLDKYERGFRRMVNVWGADHKGYIKRLQAAVEAVTGGKAELDVRICNLVSLSENGVPVPMSKRSGNFVSLREVVDQVGKDAVRFIMLTRSNTAPLEFDLARVVEQSRDNPVFYVQYAHARCCSVLRNAREVFPNVLIDDSELSTVDMSLLEDEAEFALIRLLAGWPRLVESAASAGEPHRVALYLQELAAGFHGLWNLGKEEERLRFIEPDNENRTLARLALVRATAIAVASGLQVMGICPVEEMR